jgi:hypothetical protein
LIIPDYFGNHNFQQQLKTIIAMPAIDCHTDYPSPYSLGAPDASPFFDVKYLGWWGKLMKRLIYLCVSKCKT